MHTLRLLRRDDLQQAMTLKVAAGWNQTEDDWRRLLRLEPPGCFAIETEGVIAATATVVCYGASLAWIGMVLTLPEYRGRGYAQQLMERSIAYAEERGVSWIKLDATDMGAPIYRKLGFTNECPIERWRRPPSSLPAGKHLDSVIDFDLDAAVSGADRRQLLVDLAREGCASLTEGGFAMGRPGANASYFGPCIARDEPAARTLLEWHLTRFADQGVFWDILPENAQAVEIAREFGFVPQRALIRMVRPGKGGPLLTCDYRSTYAIAGFEYG